MIDILARAETRRFLFHIDWYVFLSALAIALLGVATMHPLGQGGEAFFDRQLIWIGIAVAVFFLTSLPSYSFLRRTPVVAALYALALALLAFIFVAGTVVKGAQQRFDLGFFALQPSDPAKLVLIIVLAKYFARRHVEIGHLRHIFVSGFYAGAICLLVFLQPDFGGAIIIASVWLGMVLVSGISWKHLAALMVTGLVLAGGLWSFVLEPIRKRASLPLSTPWPISRERLQRVPIDRRCGSGEATGKGRLRHAVEIKILPEYQTDFIFAAYAEEWGFVGVLLLLGLFAVLILRTLSIASHGADNFAVLFGVGVSIMFLAHFIVHIGMNMGLLPVTGTTIPFMSYGGSHLITEFAALGILMGLRRRSRTVSRIVDKTDEVGEPRL